MTDDIDAAADAIRHGQLVVYPTETVYGLGANALDADAVERVYAAKNRNREKPVSMAVPDLETATEYTQPTERERAFIERFLPGPVTVVVERTGMVPDVLTAGRNRVGIRIPDHDLARSMLESASPVTATSANVSGNPSAQSVAGVDQRVREYATVVLDGGETPGGGSTVVDVTHDEIHRRGALAAEVEMWLDEH
jgi:L-threonylcarbamoyladenylate synthase